MKNFIKNMFSSDSEVSSKRVFGAIGFISSIVFIAIWKRDLIEVLLITSASMIGLETITNIFKPKQQ
jgi:hypothetical protein